MQTWLPNPLPHSFSRPLPQSCLRKRIHPGIPVLMPLIAHSRIPSFARRVLAASRVYLPMHLFVCSLIHLFAHPFDRPLIHSLLLFLACMRSVIHSWIYTHAYMPPTHRLFIHSSVPLPTASLTQYPKYAQSRTHASTPSCPQSLTHSLVRAFLYICAHALKLPLALSFTHPPISHLLRPSISALTHSLCHSFVFAVIHLCLLFFIRPHVFSAIYLFLYSLTHRAPPWLFFPFHPLTHLFVHPFCHSSTYCPIARSAQNFRTGAPRNILGELSAKGNLQGSLAHVA